MSKSFGNLIGDEWCHSGQLIKNVSPLDADGVIGEYAIGSDDDVGREVAAARSAQVSWKRTTLQARADILFKVAKELSDRNDELGELLTREEGKTRAEGIGEVGRVANVLRVFAGEVLRLTGENLTSVRPNVSMEIGREPVGVVGVIRPWNFPIAIPSWKIGPALAFGNTVGRLQALRSRTIKRLGAGRYPPSGRHTGGRIQPSDGWRGDCARNYSVVSTRISRSRWLVRSTGSYFQTGQRCTASSRLIVVEQIPDRFVDALANRLEKLVVGHALDPSTQIEPVVNRQQFDQDMHYIDMGEREGARGRLIGRRPDRKTSGFYLPPTLFTETSNAMRINRYEIFGLVASVIRVKNYDEALSVANDTEFGLSAGIITNSRKHARHFHANSESGLVMVNLPTAGLDYHVPFGGKKALSYGKRVQGGMPQNSTRS